MSWLLNKKLLGTLVLQTLSLTHTGAEEKTKSKENNVEPSSSPEKAKDITSSKFSQQRQE
jgi:hypothetical protein